MKREIALYRRLATDFTIGARSVPQLPSSALKVFVLLHQPTLCLILCQTKDRILAEYALRDIHKPIGVADYELTRALPKELASSLPSIEDIEAELSENLKVDAE